MTPPRRILAALAVLTLAATAALVTAAPAQAAVRHLGFQGGSGTGAGWLGDVETSSSSGLYAYCVDPYGLFPSGDTGGTGLVGSIPGTTASANPGHNGTQNVTGHDIEKLNYALWNWGDATTAVHAAAMDAYVYTLSSADHPGTGVDFFVNIRVPSSQRAAVKARYRVIAADTEAHWNDASRLAAHTTVTVTDAANQKGYVDVSITPASATGTLTLTHATQDGSGATTVHVSNGDHIAITGSATATRTYTIRADVSATGPYDYEKNVRLYTTPANDQYQRVIRHGDRSRPTVSAHDVSAPLSVEFSPVVSTSVTSELVNPGQTFVDRVTAYSAAGAWYPGASVVGDYTIYGPFADQPAAAAAVPADVPVAATGSATFTGPSTVDVTGTTPAAASGWYAWVWTIRTERQDATTQGTLPAGYAWQSVFADPAESTAVPITVRIETESAQKTVGLYSAVADKVTLTHDAGTGSWWTSGGAPVVVTLDGTAYWVTGDTAPAPSDSAPSTAVALGTVSLQASAPGTYDSPSVTVPSSAAGYVVWQWRVHPDPRVLPHSEPWGEPSQITRVLPPTVATTAATDVAPGATVHDIAHVAGPAPSEPVSLVFEAFRQTTDVATCTDETRVVDTRSAPNAVTAPGDYESPAATFDRVGTYFWVATLLAPDGSVISTGTCGAPNETSAVLPFTVTTNALPSVQLGKPAKDVATVSGPTPPGASLVFRAYRLADTAKPVCDASTLVFESTPVALTGAGDYESEPATFTGGATYAWVETASDAAGVAITSGVCGEKTELTTVRPLTVTTDVDATDDDATVGPGTPATDVATATAATHPRGPAQLAFTGSAFDPAVFGAVAGGLLVAGAVLMLVARRCRGAARK